MSLQLHLLFLKSCIQWGATGIEMILKILYTFGVVSWLWFSWAHIACQFCGKLVRKKTLRSHQKGKKCVAAQEKCAKALSNIVASPVIPQPADDRVDCPFCHKSVHRKRLKVHQAGKKCSSAQEECAKQLSALSKHRSRTENEYSNRAQSPQTACETQTSNTMGSIGRKCADCGQFVGGSMYHFEQHVGSKSCKQNQVRPLQQGAAQCIS